MEPIGQTSLVIKTLGDEEIEPASTIQKRVEEYGFQKQQVAKAVRELDELKEELSAEIVVAYLCLKLDVRGFIITGGFT